MKKIFLLIALFLASSAMFAQDIEGTWKGLVVLPGGELRLVFHITATDEGYSSTMDSPDQNAFGLPVSSTEFKDKELTIKMPDLDFIYTGKLTEDNLIKGKMVQMGQTIELDLKRNKEE